MKVSVDLTLTPLRDEYEHSIKTFIKKIRSLGFKVIENPLSTQIYMGNMTLSCLVFRK